jgi:hypothetical protein
LCLFLSRASPHAYGAIMTTTKLERDQVHTINAHQADQLYLWDSPIQSDRQNLTLRDHGGNDCLTIYALTYDQLANLYLDISRVLGRSPDPMIHHLKQIHETIGMLIKDAEAVEPQEYEPFDFFASE